MLAWGTLFCSINLKRNLARTSWQSSCFIAFILRNPWKNLKISSNLRRKKNTHNQTQKCYWKSVKLYEMQHGILLVTTSIALIAEWRIVWPHKEFGLDKCGSCCCCCRWWSSDFFLFLSFFLLTFNTKNQIRTDVY